MSKERVMALKQHQQQHGCSLGLNIDITLDNGLFKMSYSAKRETWPVEENSLSGVRREKCSPSEPRVSWVES